MVTTCALIAAVVLPQAVTEPRRPAVNGADHVVSVLPHGSIDERRQALAWLRTTQLAGDWSGLRRALGHELWRAIVEDREDAARTATSSRLRTGSDEREYLGELIATVAGLRMQEMLPLLVRVDHFASTHALTMFEAEAVPFVIDALERPAPPGYSAQYRSELVYALVRVLQSGVEPDPAMRARIVDALRTVIATPDSERELINGFDLLLELDDESFDPLLRKWVAEPLVAGSSGENAAQIQRLAKRILESRVVIR